MPRFIIERAFRPDVTEERAGELGRRSTYLIDTKFTDLIWEHSHGFTAADGTLCSMCIFTAPDMDRLRQHAEDLGAHDIIRIIEITDDYSPADFLT